MSLFERHLELGATLAPDGIPLHFGDQKSEYHAALEQAVIMDRSHEGRLEARGRDRFSLINRISTNDVLNLAAGEGRPTIFTNPHGRILDRIMIYNRGEHALLTTEPGRNTPLLHYLQRQVFFSDEVTFSDITTSTRQFVLHGPQAEVVAQALAPRLMSTTALSGLEAEIAQVPVFLAQRKPLTGGHWAIIVPAEQADTVWLAALEIGRLVGLIPAGSLVYNALRIRAGRPATGRELTADYIPLEAGLWDEVSFTKGCYTGQEIIARMESRNRLAKTMVSLRLSSWVEAPATLYMDGKAVGNLTSSVIAPNDEILGIGFVKVPAAIPGQTFEAGVNTVPASVISLAGVQSPQLAEG